MDRLIKLLKTNARLSDKELAAMLGVTEKDVADKIAQLEKSGVIKGYTAIIDEELTDND